MKKLVKVVMVVMAVMVVMVTGLVVTKANGYSFRPTKYSGASETIRAYVNWLQKLEAKSGYSLNEMYGKAHYCDNSDEVEYYVLIDGDSNPIGRLYNSGWIKAIDEMDDMAYQAYCAIDVQIWKLMSGQI